MHAFNFLSISLHVHWIFSLPTFSLIFYLYISLAFHSFLCFYFPTLFLLPHVIFSDMHLIFFRFLSCFLCSPPFFMHLVSLLISHLDVINIFILLLQYSLIYFSYFPYIVFIDVACEGIAVYRGVGMKCELRWLKGCSLMYAGLCYVKG